MNPIYLKSGLATGNIGFLGGFTSMNSIYGTVELIDVLNEGVEFGVINPVFPFGPTSDITFNATAEKPNGGDSDIVLKLTTTGQLIAERLPNNSLPAGTKLFIEMTFYTGVPAAMSY